MKSSEKTYPRNKRSKPDQDNRHPNHRLHYGHPQSHCDEDPSKHHKPTLLLLKAPFRFIKDVVGRLLRNLRRETLSSEVNDDPHVALMRPQQLDPMLDPPLSQLTPIFTHLLFQWWTTNPKHPHINTLTKIDHPDFFLGASSIPSSAIQLSSAIPHNLHRFPKSQNQNHPTAICANLRNLRITSPNEVPLPPALAYSHLPVNSPPS